MYSNVILSTGLLDPPTVRDYVLRRHPSAVVVSDWRRGRRIVDGMERVDVFWYNDSSVLLVVDGEDGGSRPIIVVVVKRSGLILDPLLSTAVRKLFSGQEKFRSTEETVASRNWNFCLQLPK